VTAALRPSVIFAFIGGIGFCVDGGILTLLYRVQGMDLYVSRLVSFSFASLVTWLLNRTYVFQAKRAPSCRDRSREYAAYVGVQATGALINLSIFMLIIWLFPSLAHLPIAPLAAGSILAMFFNYGVLRSIVYHGSMAVTSRGLMQ